jgi:ABC-type uncharacterized transport system YnjBCD permease subunit
MSHKFMGICTLLHSALPQPADCLLAVFCYCLSVAKFAFLLSCGYPPIDVSFGMTLPNTESSTTFIMSTSLALGMKQCQQPCHR